MNKPTFKKVLLGIVGISCVAVLCVYFFPVTVFSNEFQQELFENVLRYFFCSVAAVCLLLYLDIKLFSKPEKVWVLLPCLIIAVDNFPFISYYNGNMELIRTAFTDVFLFAFYCVFVGLFEECVFRGIIFSVFAERLPKNKKGFLITYFLSSALFGLAHLFNLFSGAGFFPTILQVGYTTLTGGLFAFALIKTKNVVCCGILHGIYNFCGLILSEHGLGSGIVFDTGTVVMMAIVSVGIGIYVLYSVFRYSEEERTVLYEKLSIR